MRVLCTAFVLVLFSSCGGVQKMALSTTAELANKASINMEKERDWEVFKETALSNLKFLEGMLENDPGNETLLLLLAKGYGAYAFGVHETMDMDDLYKDRDRRPSKGKAIHLYSKALNFGLRYLNEKGIHYEMLMKNMNVNNGIKNLLSSNLSSNLKDQELILFTAQSLGGLINLQKNNMNLVSNLGVVKGMFDWLCGISPDISFGACHIFYGAYEAGRPKFLGGNPKKGKDIFEKAIKRYPNNHLIKTAYMQFYLIPFSKEKTYKRLKAKLNSLNSNYPLSWEPTKTKDYRGKLSDRLNLYNAIAKKRLEIISKNEKDLF